MSLTLPVIDVGLDTDYIKKIFEQISEDRELLYISEETKECIRKYKEKINKDNAKDLWKDLLIDAICLLKINDSREKLYNDTCKIVNKEDENYLDKFSSIRSISAYGIDELSGYFDDFVAFESVLYGTGEFYRDHIHHVLNVWVLGVGLLFGHAPISINLSEDFKVSKKDFHFQIENDKSQSISKGELWSMWTIIALCHDLGYPLEKASQINQKVRKIVNHFGCLNFNELNFNFDILNTFIVEKYLNIISSKTVKSDENCPDENFEQHHTKIQHKYHDKFSKSLEDYKHGAFSGLLLFKKLTYFLETDYAPTNETLSTEDLRQFYIRKEILRSICGHTCPKIYHLHLNTLSFLLIICDELQEWGRPRFEDMLSGERKDKQVGKLIKFQTNENTEIHVEIKYKDLEVKEKTNQEEIEENIVKKKFKNFLCLLRSAKDDEKRKVKFKWEIIFQNQQYVFNFDTGKSSYEMYYSYSQDITDEKKPGEEEKFHIYKQQ